MPKLDDEDAAVTTYAVRVCTITSNGNCRNYGSVAMMPYTVRVCTNIQWQLLQQNPTDDKGCGIPTSRASPEIRGH